MGASLPSSFVSGLVLLLSVLALPFSAEAAPRRPRFEPTDLEMEKPGVVEVDMQFGPAFGHSDAGRRFLAPDFELDVGLLPSLELDIDGAFSVDHPTDSTHSALGGDALWTSFKIGVYDAGSERDGYAVGLQLGPRLPVIPGMHGLGYEALLLAGLRFGRYQFALNGGAFMDPGDADLPLSVSRPFALVVGAGISMNLDEKGDVSVQAQAGTTLYVSRGHHELNVGLGMTWSASEHVDLSLMAVGNAFEQTDRLTVLVGVSPKFTLF